jgi:CBS domain-containing membrane protein
MFSWTKNDVNVCRGTSSGQPSSILHNLEMLEGELVRGLAERLRLAHFLKRFPPRPVWGAFVFLSGFITIALLAALAWFARIPFVFPSLGPTAFLFFFTALAPAASPRNALFGHAIGLFCGYVSLWLLGLQHAPSAMLEGVNGPRVVAAALSLASTGALMIFLQVIHPPAGATTLIVSLGIVTEPFHLLIIELAVALMALLAIGINRLAGLDYPLWSKRAAMISHGPVASAPMEPRGNDMLRRGGEPEP